MGQMMIHISRLKGVEFDVDDTLLNNQPNSPLGGLHERSRMAAVREVGRQRGIPGLERVTIEETTRAFTEASEHSVPGAVWRTLVVAGLVHSVILDPKNELLLAIVALKNQLHEKIIREEGTEVPGASHFVEALASNGLKDRLAIASMAVLRDINIFFGKYPGLRNNFPRQNCVTRNGRKSKTTSRGL